MWSPYYQRRAEQTGLRNTQDGFGVLSTWPTVGTSRAIPGWLTSLFSISIDRCLISSGFEGVETRVGADAGSDHKPLVVDFQVVGDGI